MSPLAMLGSRKNTVAEGGNLLGHVCVVYKLVTNGITLNWAVHVSP